jgi:hypothetical protein
MRTNAGRNRRASRSTRRKQAYLRAASGDTCGVLRLAGRSIATPFTGATAGALVVGELLWLCQGGPRVGGYHGGLVVVSHDDEFMNNLGLTHCLRKIDQGWQLESW